MPGSVERALRAAGLCSLCALIAPVWAAADPVTPPAGAEQQAAAWIQHDGHRFDLNAEPARFDGLLRAVGGARVIALGEAVHETHEFLALRNQVFEYLVLHGQVTTIALETGTTEAALAEDYVRGAGRLDAATVNSVFSWIPAASADNAALLNWMRQYNLAHPQRPVKLHGMDLSGGRMGRFTESRAAVDAALEYLGTVDKAAGTRLHEQLDPLLDRFTTDAHGTLSSQQRNDLTGGLQELLGLFELNATEWPQHSSLPAFQRAYRNAQVAVELDRNFRLSSSRDPKVLRDAFMALNVRQLLAGLPAGERLMVFAHNTHVRNGPAPAGFVSMGQQLRAALGPDLVTIGTTFDRGSTGVAGHEADPIEPSPEHTLNAIMSTTLRHASFVIDLRSVQHDTPLGNWLSSGQPLRTYRFEGSPGRSFDVLIYVDRISPLLPFQVPQNEASQ